ncbi:transposase [Candidatus Gottesmanbacteria bacterium]|nr:transposase [Candidatus Gottesmanbacteria bacterium]
MRFSEFAKLPSDAQSFVWQKLLDKSLFDVDIISYCFMPNHFHLLLRQRIDKGVSRFVSNTTNGYTKYFNTKHHRVGPLLQGTFKAVWVETEEQLLHLTRYIHLNPTTNYLVQEQNLQDYPWSSFQEYFGLKETGICDTSFLRSTFPSGKVYEEFVLDQVDYARELEKIKHLSIDED